MDYLDDSETHNMEKLNKTLIQFHLKFWQLVGQEDAMAVLYRDAIDELEK